MDQLTQLLGSVGAVLFLLGVIALLVGLPAWLWLCVRFFRDVHAMRESLEVIAGQQSRHVAAAHSPAASEVSLSAFGR